MATLLIDGAIGEGDTVRVDVNDQNEFYAEKTSRKTAAEKSSGKKRASAKGAQAAEAAEAAEATEVSSTPSMDAETVEGEAIEPDSID